MKNFTLLILAMLISSLGFSQGVLQEQGVVLSTNTSQNQQPLPFSVSEEECGFETPSNNFETSVGSLKNYIIANDFVVDESMGVFSLEAITFHAVVEPGGEIEEADYIFYEDSDEGPGSEITSLQNMEATSVEVIGEYNVEGEVGDVLEVYLELDEPITFEAGDNETVYWMGVQVPNYTGSSIALELIAEVVTPNETFVFLAGDWHGLEGLFGVTRDGVMSLSGTCSASEECTEVSAGNLEGPESVCALSEFVITAQDATAGVSGVTYIWEQSPIGEEDWTVIEGATSLNLTMEEGIEEPTQFRFTIECESGSEDTTEPFEVDLNPAEDCYCVPEYGLGCEDGDTINQVMIENDSGEIIFQNDSDCGENGYLDYTETLDAPEMLQGEAYTMTITSESELTDQEDVSVWVDFNQDGVFSEGEEIGSTGGEGLSEEGEFSFQFTIPQDLEFGTYRIRVRLAWLGGDAIGPCENRSYGEAEDYAIEIVEELGVDNAVFNQFTFYPNPVENQLYLSAENPIEELKVYNLLGKEVLKASPNTREMQLQTQGLPTGVYLMKVKLEGVQKTYKLIKQ